jgi:hypothetical protein
VSAAALSAEFRLAAACCIRPPGETRDAAVRAAASASIDWPAFRAMVERQRIQGLAREALRAADIAMPEAIAATLNEIAIDTARGALQLASEALTLQEALDAASIPALFIKGSSLAMLAYGNLAIKHAWDIDLLVLPQDVARACAVFERAGYARILPPATLKHDRFVAWLEFAREAIFYHPARGTSVELHWRLSDNAAQLDHVTAASPSQSVVIAGGRTLRTLRDEDLFAYLCLHGAHHAWARLKWLADLSAWLVAKGPAETERLYRHAQSNGVGRGAAQALLLCHALFGLDVPAPLLAEMQSDRAIRWLVTIAYEAMAGRAGQSLEQPLGSFKIEASHFLLASGLRYWLQELRSKSIGWTDFQRFALPRPLYFLYPVLRGPSWAWRKAASLWGQPAR